MGTVLTITLLVLLLGLSFLFSGMETGILSLNRLRMRQLMREGNNRARQLNRYLSEPETFLWTILVGNTLTNTLAALLILRSVHGGFPGDPIAFSIGGIGVVLLFYVLGELVPKTLFGMFPNRLCLMLITPFRLVKFFLRPLVLLVELLAGGLLRNVGGRAFAGNTFANREELRWLMQESGQGFTSEERAMISRVMDLEKLTVRSQLITWKDVISVEANADMQHVMNAVRNHRFSRMPVWEMKDGRRRVAGLISLKRMLFETELDENRKADDYATPALFLDESKRLEDALQLMQKTGHRMAVVVDRRKKEIGIICLQDIVKVIFGEVRL